MKACQSKNTSSLHYPYWSFWGPILRFAAWCDGRKHWRHATHRKQSESVSESRWHGLLKTEKPLQSKPKAAGTFRWNANQLHILFILPRVVTCAQKAPVKLNRTKTLWYFFEAGILRKRELPASCAFQKNQPSAKSEHWVLHSNPPEFVGSLLMGWQGWEVAKTPVYHIRTQFQEHVGMTLESATVVSSPKNHHWDHKFKNVPWNICEMVSTGFYPHNLTHVFGGIVVSQVKYTFGLLGLRTGVPLPACTCTLATAAPGWTGTWMRCVSIANMLDFTTHSKNIPCIENWKLKTVSLTMGNVYDQNIC